MSYKLSEREWDALQLAGFTSVEELLKRYFELQKQENKRKLMQAFEDLYGGEPSIGTVALGSGKCQINLSQRR